MAPRVIVLNGGSSAGKTSIARCLQTLLPEPWLRFGVDSLIEAAPAELWGSPQGLVVAADGAIAVGPAFRALEAAWYAGIAAMARAGARIILDEVFLSGQAAQVRWRSTLEGLEILWVGVRCDAAEATRREAARGDREPGMAAQQAELVHRGVHYDLEVDSAVASPMACAGLIVPWTRDSSVSSSARTGAGSL
jgi:chloramphenicol 3-O phosphotransferase